MGYTLVGSVCSALWSSSTLDVHADFHPSNMRPQSASSVLLFSPELSTIILNTSTSLAADLRLDARRVNVLSGEAYFSVEPDADRPFEVRARDGLVRAIGTGFNVEIDGARVTVSVLEGRVAVVSDAAGPTDRSDPA